MAGAGQNGGKTRGKNRTEGKTVSGTVEQYHVMACDTCELVWQLHCVLDGLQRVGDHSDD